ncbi:MAG: AraC family transcriptional regulator [Gammaproteobacteria bacterium HGW-Gammaproteobacteria-13]|nr:MAG: AraC family transcriptional regulator [Gammaproteobacteria bacterium HGW-Gammaproteobacteria-13]
MSAVPYSLPRRSITSVQLLTQLGLDHGLSVERCLHKTGLSPLQLAELHSEIEGAQELQLIRNLIDALPAQYDLGLQAGLRYQLTTYGIWGYALLSSQSFRQAADLGLRYLDLTFAFNRITLCEDASQAHLQLDGSHLPDQLRDFLLLRDAVAVMVIQRELTGARVPLSRVQLSMPAPADPTRFIEQFGLLPEFACAQNRISFSRHLLDLPLPRANPHNAQLCELQCQALLAKRQVRSGLAGQIRDRLLSTPGRLADMELIASELNISSRTLRRRLEDQGSSFRQLQEEVRQALAEELLAIASLSQEEIAERLGYSEVSNFLHAFKRWKGLTPGQYRQTLA